MTKTTHTHSRARALANACTGIDKYVIPTAFAHSNSGEAHASQGYFFVLMFLHGMQMRLADDILELVVGSVLTGQVKQI
jgi:hypothetical protein